MPKSSFIDVLINKGEGLDVEFKKTIDAIESEDIVSFANSSDGGFIVVGVSELKINDREIKIELTGVEVNDHDKLKILNKAQDCQPPIQLNFSNYKKNDLNLFVIQISSGNNKPYCTKKGVYKIRGDARNLVLTQELLFDIFLEKEYNKFIDNFKAATYELKDEISYVQDLFQEFTNNITENLQGISDESSDSNTAIQDIYSGIEDLNQSVFDLSENLQFQQSRSDDLEEKIDLILKKLNIEDPNITRRKYFITKQIKEILAKNKKSNIKQRKKTIVSSILVGKLKDHFTLNQNEISALYDDVFRL